MNRSGKMHMELKLRFSFALSLGVLVAAGGCTVGEQNPDGGTGSDAQIPSYDASHVTPPTCDPGQIDCGGTCTRVAADSMNCGSCGNACPDGFSCAVGRCDCAAPMLGCDGVCTDPSSDTANCGTCGNACATGQTCLAGACVTQCQDTETRCQNTADDGSQVSVCADLQTDATNCGSCNTQCVGGGVCVDGACACPDGQATCGGGCTDLQTDAENCGTCLNSCGAGGVCTGGACTTCADALTACGTPRRCVDTDTSLLHCGTCGNVCGTNETCNAGSCECPAAFTTCDGACTNPNADPHNCGACGNDCGYGGTCGGGTCTCAADATMCGTSCAILDSNHDHCGDCATACGADELCYSGSCRLINDSCGSALQVMSDVTVPGEATSNGGAPPSGSSCGGGSGSQALYYEVTVPAGHAVGVDTSHATQDLVLFEQAACGDTACVLSSDSPESLALLNQGSSDITRIVGVRAYSSSHDSDTTYDIQFTYTAFVANGSCDMATAVTTDTTLTGEYTLGGGSSPSASACGSGSGNQALYYSVSIPAGGQVDVTASNTSHAVVLFEQSSCGATACAGYASSPDSLTLLNPTGSEITRIVGVRGSSTAASYDLGFTYSTGSFAANAACSTATAVNSDASFSAEDTSMGGLRPEATGCGGGGGQRALYYAVTVPAGKQVDVTTNPTGDIILFEEAACGDVSCLGYTDSSPEQTTLLNPGTSDVTYIVGVRGYSSATTYDIDFTYSTATFAANATCGNATPVTADGTITAEDTETGGPRPGGSGCGYGSGARALYYEVTVPAGQAVDVSASTGAAEVVLFEQTACGDVNCLDYASFGDSLTLANPGTSDVTRIVGVRGYDSPDGFSPGGVYSITFAYSTPTFAANATCAGATVVTSNSSFTNEDTAGGGPRASGSMCGSGSGNAALFYAVTIPAGHQVAVVTAPSGDIVLFEQAACGDTDCLQYTDSSPEQLTLSNSGSSEVMRIIGVRPYSSSSSPTYDVDFTYSSL